MKFRKHGSCRDMHLTRHGRHRREILKIHANITAFIYINSSFHLSPTLLFLRKQPDSVKLNSRTKPSIDPSGR